MRTSSATQVFAQPLSWGCPIEAAAARDKLAAMITSSSGSNKDRRASPRSFPDLLIAADVSYQHDQTGGSGSNWAILLETILEVTDGDTVFLFGHRVRMPGSNDLLEMILEHFEYACPTVEAERIEPAYAALRKHNTSAHILKRKSGLPSTAGPVPAGPGLSECTQNVTA
jgi:hypothetical protein